MQVIYKQLFLSIKRVTHHARHDVRQAQCVGVKCVTGVRQVTHINCYIINQCYESEQFTNSFTNLSNSLRVS